MKKNMISKITSLLLVGISASMIGCSADSDSGTSDAASLSFPTNAVVAEPTLENGILVEDAVATNQTSNISLLNGVESSSKLNVALLGTQVSDAISKKIKGANLNSYALNGTISESYSCSGGGIMSINATETEFVSATMTMSLAQCNEGGTVMNGSIYGSLSNYDANFNDYKDMTLKFTSDFTVTEGATQSKIVKNSYMTANVLSYTYSSMTAKYAMSMQATDGTDSYGIKDAIYYGTSDGYYTSMYQTQGRIYINNLASYVDYDTTYDMSATPFVFSGSSITSGEARYNMENGGKVKIAVESYDNPITYVDVNGDGTYELREI